MELAPLESNSNMSMCAYSIAELPYQGAISEAGSKSLVDMECGDT